MRPSTRGHYQPGERATAGEEKALPNCFPFLYQELRQLSRKYLRRESNRRPCKPRHWFMKPICGCWVTRKVAVKDRAHFLAIAARSMRQIFGRTGPGPSCSETRRCAKSGHFWRIKCCAKTRKWFIFWYWKKHSRPWPLSIPSRPKWFGAAFLCRSDGGRKQQRSWEFPPPP